jgi:mRNA interferase MazF
VVSCDNILAIPVAALRRAVGRLMPDQEAAPAAAIVAAFDLNV